MQQHAVMVTAAVLGFCGVTRAWLMGPMWLDQSFIPLQYADRLARGFGFKLAGQFGPIEGFTNPIWVALFGGLGGLNVHEAEIQAAVGLLLYGWLIVFCVRQIWSLHGRWISLLPVGLLGLAPVVAAVRDGSDTVWLALWSVVAAVGVTAESEGERSRHTPPLALFVLSVSGLFGMVISLGLALIAAPVHRWRCLRVVFSGILCVVVLRWAIFGTWASPVFIGPENGLEALWLMPIFVAMGWLGILFGRPQWRRTMALAWVLVVGTGFAAWTGQTTHGFGAALIPVMGAVTLLASNVLAAHRSVLWGLVLIGAAVMVDVRQTEAKLPDVAHARMSDFLQSRGMGRFLLWRFEPDDRVVVHKPGAVPYYSRRPVVDLSGRLHGHPVTPDAALAHDPVAVLPDRKLVSRKAQRLAMQSDWPDRLEKRYNQYAIQHQKAWQMVDVNPVWFHIYIRRDLPMLRAEIPQSNGNILPRADPFGPQQVNP